MADKIPSLAESCEAHWKGLFDAVRELTCASDPVQATLQVVPLEDGLKKELVVDEAGNICKTPFYSLDNFLLYVAGGKRPAEFIGPVYLGCGKRRQDPDSNRFDYSSGVVRQLRHEIGLRLERLKTLGRDVYLTSKLLGYEKREATKEFISGLLDSESKELGVVTQNILK